MVRLEEQAAKKDKTVYSRLPGNSPTSLEKIFQEQLWNSNMFYGENKSSYWLISQAAEDKKNLCMCKMYKNLRVTARMR